MKLIYGCQAHPGTTITISPEEDEQHAGGDTASCGCFWADMVCVDVNGDHTLPEWSTAWQNAARRARRRCEQDSRPNRYDRELRHLSIAELVGITPYLEARLAQHVEAGSIELTIDTSRQLRALQRVLGRLQQPETTQDRKEEQFQKSDE